VVTHGAAKRILDWSKTLKSNALCLSQIVMFYYGTIGCRDEGYESVYRSRSTSQLNGTRVEVLEREYGWSSGKSSEDLNPTDGCGAK
jgi:hypothetical protein